MSASRHYRLRRDWDAAFDVIVRWLLFDELEPLVRAAMDDLLDTARLPTLHRWCEFASDADLEAATFSVARAEVAVRYGRHVEAIAHGEERRLDSDTAFRAVDRRAGGTPRIARGRGFGAVPTCGSRCSDRVRAARCEMGPASVRVELEKPEADDWLRALASGSKTIRCERKWVGPRDWS